MARRRNHHNQNRQFQDPQGESYDNNMNQPGRNHGNNNHNSNRGRNNTRGNFGNNNGRGGNHHTPNNSFAGLPGGFPPQGPRHNVFQNNGNDWDQGPARRNPPMNPPPSPNVMSPTPNPRYKGKNFDPNYRPQNNPQNTPQQQNSRPGNFTHQNYRKQQLQQLIELMESTEEAEPEQPGQPQQCPNPLAHMYAGAQYEEHSQFQTPQLYPMVDSSGDWIMTNSEELSYMYFEFARDVRLLLEGLATHEGIPKIRYYMQQFEAARRGSPLAQLMHEMLHES